LPPGFVKIRHFGFLANRNRAAALTLCREHLKADAPTLPASGAFTKNSSELWNVAARSVKKAHCASWLGSRLRTSPFTEALPRWPASWTLHEDTDWPHSAATATLGTEPAPLLVCADARFLSLIGLPSPHPLVDSLLPEPQSTSPRHPQKWPPPYFSPSPAPQKHSIPIEPR
jgi:hypothetical protein